MTEKISIPDFRSEAEEREFWDSHDVTELVASDQWEKSGARGRAQTTTFAIRLNEADVEKIRALAHARGIGPTQLARMWLLDRIRLEQAAGELANPDADEQELQIRRKVLEDVSSEIPGIIIGALAAFGIGKKLGEAASKSKRARSAKEGTLKKGTEASSSERRVARG